MKDLVAVFRKYGYALLIITIEHRQRWSTTVIAARAFFRQATLMMCGNLESESAMAACLEYMRPFIPLDPMCLQINEPSLGAIRID